MFFGWVTLGHSMRETGKQSGCPSSFHLWKQEYQPKSLMDKDGRSISMHLPNGEQTIHGKNDGDYCGPPIAYHHWSLFVDDYKSINEPLWFDIVSGLYGSPSTSNVINLKASVVTPEQTPSLEDHSFDARVLHPDSRRRHRRWHWSPQGTSQGSTGGTIHSRHPFEGMQHGNMDVGIIQQWLTMEVMIHR